MSVRGLRRVIISVADLDRSLAVYRDALGLTTNYAQGDIVSLGGPGFEVMVHRRPPTSGLAGVAISFLVDDVDAATEAVVRAGATTIDKPDDQPWGERQAVLTDPDGHVFCLVAPVA